jgi:hypothetical protein
MKSQGMTIYNPLSQRAAISECFTSLLARSILGKDKTVENRLITWKGHTGIISIDFNPDKNRMFVPAADIYRDKAKNKITLDSIDRDGNKHPAAEMSMRFLSDYIPVLVPDAINMAYIDALTRNHDRHFQNWEIEIRNGEPVGLSLLYDFDASFPILKQTNVSKFVWNDSRKVTTFDDLLRGLCDEHPSQLFELIEKTDMFIKQPDTIANHELDYNPLIAETAKRLEYIKPFTIKQVFLEPIRKDKALTHTFSMSERKMFFELCKSECFRDDITNLIRQQENLFSDNGLFALRSIMKANGLISSVNENKSANRYITSPTTLNMNGFSKNSTEKSNTDMQLQ